MKLFEIAPIPPERFEMKSGESPKTIDLLDVGSGTSARAYASHVEPGTVRKISSYRTLRAVESDSYYQYIKKITANDRMSKNPYFPKIYDLGVIKNTHKEGSLRFYFYVDIERLLPLDSLSEDEADLIGRNLFSDWEQWKVRRSQYGKGKRFIGNKKFRIALSTYFKELLFEQTGDPQHKIISIKDPYLKQAILFIKNLIEKNSAFRSDMHRENVMVRRGRHIPQLVLNDPIAGGGFDIS